MSTVSPDAPPCESSTPDVRLVAKVRSFYESLVAAKVDGLGHSSTASWSLFVDDAAVFTAWLTVLGLTGIRLDVPADTHVSVRNEHVTVQINRRHLPTVTEQRSVEVRTTVWPEVAA